jgi:hypothetical protein
MEEIRIPRSIGAAQKALTGLDGLITAREWERAAIVAAFTHDGRGRKNTENRVSAVEFARNDIAGLRDADTVNRYRRSWQAAVDAGLVAEARPGQKVTLPDAPWADYYDSTDGDERYDRIEAKDALREQARSDGVGETKVLDIAKNRSAMASAIKADPKVAEAALDALVSKHPTGVEREGVRLREETNRRAFDKIRSERRAQGDSPLDEAKALLGGRRPMLEASGDMNQIDVHARHLGSIRGDFTDDERVEILEDLEETYKFLGLVVDLYRSARPLTEELAEFLAGEGGIGD